MDGTVWLLAVAMTGAGWFLVRHVGVNLSATSVLLSLLLVLHGPAYFYYTRVWGPETEFFERIMSAAPDAPVLESLDLALALLFGCVCVGVKLTDLLTSTTGRRMRAAIARWGAAPVTYSPVDRGRLRLLVVLSIVFLLPFVVIDQQLPKVIEYFTSDLGEVEKIALRREGGGSEFYTYNLLTSNFFPFMAFCIVAARGLGSRRDSAVFYIFVGLLALAKAATLSKAPLAVMFVQFAVVLFMCRSLQVSTRISTWLIGLSIGGFVAMTMVANSDIGGVVDSLEFMFYRGFMVVNEGLVEYFSAIPHVIDHSWNPLPAWLSSEKRLPAYWLVGEIHRGEIGSTTTVMFLGDAWADLAWTGVAFAAIAMGALVRFLDVHLILRLGPGVYTIAALGLAHQGIFVAFNTSLQTALLTGGLLLVLPLAYMLTSRRPKRTVHPDTRLTPAEQHSSATEVGS